MRRWRTVLWTAVALLAAACGGGGGAGGSPDDAALRPPPTREELAVDVRTEDFVDSGRGTPAYGSEAASPGRALRTRVFSPTPGQPGAPYPLVVFAHGSGGLGSRYDVLLRTVASAGYVVAAPAFPVATGSTEEGEWGADLPNLPGDVSFVIGETLRLSGSDGGPLSGAVDPGKVGVAGHSMGGMVTLAVAGNTCCHDPRVKAAVVLAGRETPFGSGQFWARISTPVLLVHGDADNNVPYTDGRRAYANAPPPRFLLTIIGGDHGAPYTADPDDPQAKVVADATLDFLDHYLGDAPDGLSWLRARADVPGVARLDREL